MTLDIHPANAEERAQAFANLHDAWGRGLSPEEHLRWRLGFAKHRNARWYVGCADGRVVSGCGCYDFELAVDGRLRRGCAIGEVHTLAELRGRGFAARLVQSVEEQERSLGRSVSLLYSDISVAYYERLGYVTCPSWEGWADLRDRRPRAAREGDRLAPLDPLREIDALVSLHAAQHRRFPLWIARSRLYWEYLIARSPGDELLWLRRSAGEPLGYVRLATAAGEVKVRDWALVQEDDRLLERLLLAVLDHGAARGAARAGGWMPVTPVTKSLFTLCPRTREITMLKPLEPGLTIAPRHLAAAEHFHEMDHV